MLSLQVWEACRGAGAATARAEQWGRAAGVPQAKRATLYVVMFGLMPCPRNLSKSSASFGTCLSLPALWSSQT